tara:strand:- start:789 stop:1013 length:225 start_codon:yes stop_codon:yes gene_type:complete
MHELKESSIGLPDFVTMTNYCEGKGYEIELIRSRKGVTCDVYKEKELKKSGTIIYNTCIEAQKEAYSRLYKALM